MSDKTRPHSSIPSQLKQPTTTPSISLPNIKTSPNHHPSPFPHPTHSNHHPTTHPHSISHPTTIRHTKTRKFKNHGFAPNTNPLHSLILYTVYTWKYYISCLDRLSKAWLSRKVMVWLWQSLYSRSSWTTWTMQFSPLFFPIWSSSSIPPVWSRVFSTARIPLRSWSVFILPLRPNPQVASLWVSAVIVMDGGPFSSFPSSAPVSVLPYTAHNH